MRLLLIRHGQTPHNVGGALDTRYPGAGLTALGQAQARALPGALTGERIRGLYASPLVRTQLTAAPLAESLGRTAAVRQGLEEVAAGDLELRSDTEAVRSYAGTLAAWMHGDLDRAMPGGERGHDVLARYDQAVRSLCAAHGPDDTVAVVSHGAIIRVYTALAARLSPEVSTELRIMNTGMGVLEGDPLSGWSLASWSSEPLGGVELEDTLGEDPTGESTDEATDDR